MWGESPSLSLLPRGQGPVCGTGRRLSVKHLDTHARHRLGALSVDTCWRSHSRGGSPSASQTSARSATTATHSWDAGHAGHHGCQAWAGLPSAQTLATPNPCPDPRTSGQDTERMLALLWGLCPLPSPGDRGVHTRLRVFPENSDCVRFRDGVSAPAHGQQRRGFSVREALTL